jgi:long-chain acyl-CoA synthetase
MGTKPNPKAWKARSSLESAHSEAPARPHPWLKAYPKSVTWDVKIEPKLLGDQLDQAVAAYGARPCTYFMGKRLSYAEIGALSDRAAKGLREEGVGEGVKVGLFMPNTPAFVIFYYGVLKAGGTVVNFNPLYSLEEIETQIRDSGVKIMVTLDLALTYDKIEALLKRRALERAVVVSFTSLLPALKSVGFKLTQRAKLAAVGRAGERARLVRAEDLLANDGRFERPAITPDAIAVLQYTGGTTGTPKGAMLSHANLSVNIGQLETWQNRIVSAGDRIVGVLPLFHVFAMTTVMNFGINHGLEIILLPKFELILTLKLIAKLRPIMMPGVPTLFNAMLRYPHIGNFDLTSLKYCMAGGAPLPIEVKRGFEAISGAILVEGYGLSETSPVAACNPPDAPREGSIGLPLPATEISIRSLDDPTVEVKTGENGEICIAGPQVMTGYWNKPQDTEDCFAGRFFRTGDVGYMDEDGYIFIVDRIKDVINASGFKVYPRRIEEALYEHPAVAEVVVIGIKDAYRGEAPKAFVKLTEGKQATGAELIHFLKEKLSKLELPAEIEFRDELPKTLIGKLSKRELRAEAKR